MQSFAPVRGVRKRLFFWDHGHRESGGGAGGKSKVNIGEAKLVARLAKQLLLQVWLAAPFLSFRFLLFKACAAARPRSTSRQ